MGELDLTAMESKAAYEENGGLPPMVKRQQYYDSLHEAA